MTIRADSQPPRDAGSANAPGRGGNCASVLRVDLPGLTRVRANLGRDLCSRRDGLLRACQNEALCKLRDEIAALLESRAEQLRKELERLTGGSSVSAGITNNTGNGAKAKRKKPSPKYRGPDGSTWSGRGARPRWLTKAIQAGQKLEEFLIVPSDEAVSEERTSGRP